MGGAKFIESHSHSAQEQCSNTGTEPCKTGGRDEENHVFFKFCNQNKNSARNNTKYNPSWHTGKR